MEKPHSGGSVAEVQPSGHHHHRRCPSDPQAILEHEAGNGLAGGSKRCSMPPSLRARYFLSNLRVDEIDALNDGIRLVGAIQTVGSFVKWVIVGIVDLFLSIVMLGESVVKTAAWLRGECGAHQEAAGCEAAPCN